MVLYFSKMSEHYELGKKGEQLALDYLTKEGYKMVNLQGFYQTQLRTYVQRHSNQKRLIN